MFENLLGNLKGKVQEHFDKKKLEKEELDKMQREVDFQRKQIFQEEFKKNALEVAKASAKKEAASASGLRKLRAKNRLRNLNNSNPANPTNYLSRFAEYTQKNLTKRDENMKRTEEMRKDAQEMKKGNLNKNTNNQTRKTFQPSGFGRRY